MAAQVPPDAAAAIQSFGRSQMGAANRETAESERPRINNDALAREEQRQCRCALGVANLADEDDTIFAIPTDWARVPARLAARPHAESCRPRCRSDGMAVARSVFGLVVQTALTSRGQDWLRTEKVELLSEDGRPYARLEILGTLRCYRRGAAVHGARSSGRCGATERSRNSPTRRGEQRERKPK